MIKKYIQLSIFFLCSSLLSGQIVSIEPAIFTMDDMITITYDATLGNGGLVGVSPVFAHTGIITEQGGPGNWQNVQGNWGTFDANVLMTAVGNDKHEISFVPRDYYSITAGTIVNQFSFVFRNVDGSKEGKTSTLGDIFVDIVDANVFSGKFTNPDSEQIVARVGDEINLSIALSQEANISLYDNNILINSALDMELDHQINISELGDHIVRFEALNANGTIEDQFSYVVIEDNPTIIDPPGNIKNGLNRIGNGSVIIALHAPMKDNVFLLSSINDFKISADYQLNLSSDQSTWWIQLDNLTSDEYYAYQFLVDGEIKIADPYSYLILDDKNDDDIASSLESVPMEYPKEFTSGHLSVFTVNEQTYNWQNDDYDTPGKTDLVIYELMLRDFLEDHSFDSLIDSLSYLKSLGVNAIELMPVSEFENNQSWGYNPSYHMALDKYYGSIGTFKKFVDEAHALDMAVILDIVYNHAFGQSPLVQLYWDAPNNRPAADSPYFNPIARHPFNVGFDFNHELDATKTYVKQTIDYWIEEYHVDGFRFDLSKGFTQTFSADDGVFASYDQSRIDILTDYGTTIWNKDSDQILILEHFANNNEEKELSDRGFMLWGNANHNFNEATMGYTAGNGSNFDHIYFGKRSWDNPHLIGYMESHDEERLMYKNLTYGNSGSNYSINNLVTGLKRNEMAAAFFFTIPGPKMVWQFGELGYDYSINWCTDGSINNNCRLTPKPVRWDYLENALRKNLFDVYSKMITLKKKHPAIQGDDIQMSLQSAMKTMQLSHTDANLCVIGNFGVEPGSVNPAFQHAGMWEDYLSGDMIEVTDVNALIDLQPGEFKVYIDNDFYLSNEEDVWNKPNFKIYPNPSNQFIQIQLADQRLTNSQLFVKIFDSMGKLVLEDQNAASINVQELASGLYYVLLMTQDNEVAIEQFVKE